MARKEKDDDVRQSAPLSGGAKVGIALMSIGLLAAIVLLLNKSPAGGAFGSSSARLNVITHFPPWKFDIPLIGKHWVVEFEGCDGAVINSGQAMKKIVTDAVNSANASMVAIIYKEFEHLGVTVLALLSESHVGIHTWPQYGYAATDVFTCGHIAQPQAAIEWMEREFKANATTSR
jgi:S-adenosylmethionine decarboxylase proenzyme